MNETVYTGDWSIASDNGAAQTIPPNDGVWKRGRMWVISSVSRGDPDYRDRYMHCIYATEYRNCLYRDRGMFGETRCAGDGCWVESLGCNFFVTESLYATQSNNSKQLIDGLCCGVVPDDWNPFQGDPTEPYNVSVHHEGVLWGYVEVGFHNRSKLNENFCIKSEDSLHVDGGSWDEIFSKHYYDPDGKGRQHRWSISDESHYEVSGGDVSGIVSIVVDWAHKKRNGVGVMQYYNHTDRATFSTIKTMPTMLNSTPQISVNITSHNNSVTPYSLISINITKNITATEIVYRNTSSIYHHKIGFLAADDDGEYFDFVDEPVWFPDESNIVTMRSEYYVINEAPLNLSELRIYVSTPYDTYEIVDYNATVINSKPSDYIQWEVMGAFLAFIVLCIVMAYRATRRFRL